jgi:hypothetical protein
MMSKKQKLLFPIGFIIVIAMIIYSSTGLGKVSCDVCVEFKGQKECKSAKGTGKDQAIEAAKGSICTDIANGRDDSIACNDRTPLQSVACTE